jgi:hypothetical protein
MMDPSYVEDQSFAVISDETVPVNGRHVRVRVYRLKANPDQRPIEAHMIYSAIASWAGAGEPADAVFHLGSFYRVTDGAMTNPAQAA